MRVDALLRGVQTMTKKRLAVFIARQALILILVGLASLVNMDICLMIIRHSAKECQIVCCLSTVAVAHTVLMAV